MKRSVAFDRMLAGALAVSLDVLTAPYGGARLPESATAPPRPLTQQEAYTLGYRLVARPAPVEPVIDADALAGWLAEPREDER